jgi:protein-tyrosine phosphatase
MRQEEGMLSENSYNWVKERYGSRLGFVRVYWHKILYALGCYKQCCEIDWHEVDRLIFVCKGNICRSPFAEAVAKSVGLDAVSCGVDAGNGVPANIYAIEAALRKGLDLGNHKTTPIDSMVLRSGDLFVAMEPCHIRQIKTRFGDNAFSTLLGLWYFPKYPSIPDPYGTTSKYFDYCFELIEKSVYEISSEIKKAASD